MREGTVGSQGWESRHLFTRLLTIWRLGGAKQFQEASSNAQRILKQTGEINSCPKIKDLAGSFDWVIPFLNWSVDGVIHADSLGLCEVYVRTAFLSECLSHQQLVLEARQDHRLNYISSSVGKLFLVLEPPAQVYLVNQHPLMDY